MAYVYESNALLFPQAFLHKIDLYPKRDKILGAQSTLYIPMNQNLRILLVSVILFFDLKLNGLAESQPQAVELLFLVKNREAELAREIDSLKFRVIETKEDLNEEGGVEDVKKEIR